MKVARISCLLIGFFLFNIKYLKLSILSFLINYHSTLTILTINRSIKIDVCFYPTQSILLQLCKELIIFRNKRVNNGSKLHEAWEQSLQLVKLVNFCNKILVSTIDFSSNLRNSDL